MNIQQVVSLPSLISFNTVSTPCLPHDEIREEFLMPQRIYVNVWMLIDICHDPKIELSTPGRELHAALRERRTARPPRCV